MVLTWKNKLFPVFFLLFFFILFGSLSFSFSFYPTEFNATTSDRDFTFYAINDSEFDIALDLNLLDFEDDASATVSSVTVTSGGTNSTEITINQYVNTTGYICWQETSTDTTPSGTGVVGEADILTQGCVKVIASTGTWQGGNGDEDEDEEEEEEEEECKIHCPVEEFTDWVIIGCVDVNSLLEHRYRYPITKDLERCRCVKGRPELETRTTPNHPMCIDEIIEQEEEEQPQTTIYDLERETSVTYFNPILLNEYQKFKTGLSNVEVSLITPSRERPLIRLDETNEFKIEEEGKYFFFFRYSEGTLKGEFLSLRPELQCEPKVEISQKQNCEIISPLNLDIATIENPRGGTEEKEVVDNLFSFTPLYPGTYKITIKRLPPIRSDGILFLVYYPEKAILNSNFLELLRARSLRAILALVLFLVASILLALFVYYVFTRHVLKRAPSFRKHLIKIYAYVTTGLVFLVPVMFLILTTLKTSLYVMAAVFLITLFLELFLSWRERLARIRIAPSLFE